KGATIVIAKTQNPEKIIGGYNPLFWDSSSGYKSTNDSFIFSFADRNNLQSAKVGYCNNNHQYAILCNSIYGPTFGGGYDLHCNYNGRWFSNPNSMHSSYPKIDDIQCGYFDV